MKPPSISVVIPVYNAMPYLTECLDSVCSQTFGDFEIICVDDGSTDKSRETLEAYASADARISILESTAQNSNAGVSRNLGLDAARGEYVIFLDADDYFEADMLRAIHESALETGADIVLFNGDKFDQQTGKVSEGYEVLKTALLPNENPFSPKDISSRLFQITSPNPWSKLYRRGFLIKEDIRFQSLPNSNDLYMTLAALSSANLIAVVNERFVHYRTATHSSTQDGKWKNPLCFLEALSKLEDRLINRLTLEVFRQSFIECSLHHMRYNLNSQKNMDARERVFAALEQSPLKSDPLNAEDRDLTKKAKTLKGAIVSALSQRAAFKDAREKRGLFRKSLQCAGSGMDARRLTIAIVHTEDASDAIFGALSKLSNLPDVEILISCRPEEAARIGDYLKEAACRDSTIAICGAETSDKGALSNIAIECASSRYMILIDSSEMVCDSAATDLDFIARNLETLLPIAEDESANLIWLRDGADSERSDGREQANGDSATGTHPYPGKRLFSNLFDHGCYDARTSNYILDREFALSHDILMMEGASHCEEAFTFSLLASANTCRVAQMSANKCLKDSSMGEAGATFSDAYGLCMNAQSCQRLVEETRDGWDARELSSAVRLIGLLFDEAVDAYMNMPQSMRGSRFALDPLEELIYRQHVITPALARQYKERLDKASTHNKAPKKNEAAPAGKSQERPGENRNRRKGLGLFHRK